MSNLPERVHVVNPRVILALTVVLVATFMSIMAIVLLTAGFVVEASILLNTMAVMIAAVGTSVRIMEKTSSPSVVQKRNPVRRSAPMQNFSSATCTRRSHSF